MINTKQVACLLASVAVSAAQNVALPNVTLPWGVWQAAEFSADSNIYQFANVRFGAQPPRFNVSGYPTYLNSSIQDSSYGPSCYQVDITDLEDLPASAPGVPGVPDILLPGDDAPAESEDCLFLDIYAPASNFDEFGRPIEELPVIVWFYGGSYALGSKNLTASLPMYTGESMLAAQDYKAIFVAGNYRLGAFGWLAGNYMESAGLPNAGLYDQTLLLTWVQKFIDQVGGNPGQVTAWGESAGAGSILHHLVREGGTVDPLFQSFLVQSPAFEWSWDNSPMGTMDQVYLNFSQNAGCGYEFDMDCLVNQDIQVLIKANKALSQSVKPTGLFPVGPSVDGTWIKQIPALSFNSGEYWPSIKRSLITHTYNETWFFTPQWVVDQKSFNNFLTMYFPESDLTPVREQINDYYDCAVNFGGDYRMCVATLIRDWTFTCNTRQLFNAFSETSYMLRYSYYSGAAAVHATDLMPTFMNNEEQAAAMLAGMGIPDIDPAKYTAGLVDGVTPWYQRYLSSFGMYLDPNTAALQNSEFWPLATQGEEIGNVLEVYGLGGAQLISDDQNTLKTCSFWTGIADQLARFNTAQAPGEWSELR